MKLAPSFRSRAGKSPWPAQDSPGTVAPLAGASFGRPARAFSLAEVMIAVGIFFMAIFAILSLVSGSLRNARHLRRLQVDAGMVAAQLLIRTNRFSEGSESGDFGDVYPDYRWQYECSQVETNGLMQFDILVFRRGVHEPVDIASILIFSPESANNGFGRPRMSGP